jgi:hypothetical protein
MLTTSSASPDSTSRLIANANPLTCSPVILGGIDSALGSVSTSTSTGPSGVQCLAQPVADSPGSSMRIPVARAMAATSGVFRSVW